MYNFRQIEKLRPYITMNDTERIKQNRLRKKQLLAEKKKLWKQKMKAKSTPKGMHPFSITMLIYEHAISLGTDHLT